MRLRSEGRLNVIFIYYTCYSLKLLPLYQLLNSFIISTCIVLVSISNPIVHIGQSYHQTKPATTNEILRMQRGDIYVKNNGSDAE